MHPLFGIARGSNPGPIDPMSDTLTTTPPAYRPKQHRGSGISCLNDFVRLCRIHEKRTIAVHDSGVCHSYLSCGWSVRKPVNRSTPRLGWRLSEDPRNVVLDWGPHPPWRRRIGFDVAFAKLLWLLVVLGVVKNVRIRNQCRGSIGWSDQRS